VKSTASETSAESVRDQLVMAVLQDFRLIYKSIKKHFSWVERKTGVGGAQLWALGAVAESPGLRVTELARAMAIHQSTASNLVERLVQADLLRRERDERDQRVVRLHPTARSRKLLQSAPQPVRGVLPDALERMSPADLRRLHGLLGDMIGGMKVRDRGGRATPLADL